MNKEIIGIVKLYSDEYYKIVSYDYIANNVNTLNILRIKLSEEYLEEVDNNKYIKRVETEAINPLILIDDWFSDGHILIIDKAWYEKNKDLVMNLVRIISKETSKSYLEIANSCLIDDSVISSLCENTSLKEVSLAKRIKNGYTLTFEDYVKFKNSNITSVDSFNVDEKLKENFDDIIKYNNSIKLIGDYTYKQIKDPSLSKLYIKNVITDYDLANFKYLDKDKIILIYINNIEYLSKIQNRLQELNLNNKIIINTKNKNELNSIVFDMDIKADNIFVNNEDVTFKKYLEYEKLLYSMIEPAKSLSPFEKYIYAYNITKQFKKYKKSEEEPTLSRNLYKILDNEYMVCVGFSELFGDLLEKLGINNIKLDVSVDISYDDVIDHSKEIDLEDKTTDSRGHARRYVYIKDKKYDIDGFYISDPTWDNDLENDYYNHLALTDEEITKHRRYNYLSISKFELFNISSIEEFYQKINFLCDKKEFSNTPSDIIYDLINTLKILDIKFVRMLESKYEYIKNTPYHWNKNISSLIYDIGNYLISHVNKTISGEKIFEAVKVLYSNFYGYDDDRIFDILKDTVSKNKERDDNLFPKRYKFYSDGKKEELPNYFNRFDIKMDGKKL
ncbi:MAG: hypothetical protein Q4E75_05820 [bacterium]|nr:hypothetical protein [bacterium]